MEQRQRVLGLFLLVALGAASQYAEAANLTVNCDKHESIHKILRLLANTNPQGRTRSLFRAIARQTS